MKYLGDGVYADNDGFHVKIKCDCMSEPNTIFLGDQEFLSFVKYGMEVFGIKRIGTDGEGEGDS